MAGALIAVCTEDPLHDELSETGAETGGEVFVEKCARRDVRQHTKAFAWCVKRKV